MAIAPKMCVCRPLIKKKYQFNTKSKKHEYTKIFIKTTYSIDVMDMRT